MRALAPADALHEVPVDDRYSETQHRTISAAMELFGEHGVSGTSFQMIAEAVGVTKAAIYHQFKTKDAIVLAVAEVGLSPLEDALAEAEGQPTPEAQRELLLRRVIDLAVNRRRWVHALQGDPVIIRLLGTHDPFVDLMARVYSVLMGLEGDGPSHRMRIAIVSAAIGAAIVHPLVVEMDDDTVRAELLAVTRRLFGIPS